MKLLYDLSSSWLIKANLLAAIVFLLASCPFDMGRFIANYNVTRVEKRGWSDQMDLDYLRRIGPSALPALKRLEQQPGWQTYTPVGEIAGELLDRLRKEQDDWRRWTFRGHRLSREMGLEPSAL